jgi:hypothetical protein
MRTKNNEKDSIKEKKNKNFKELFIRKKYIKKNLIIITCHQKNIRN